MMTTNNNNNNNNNNNPIQKLNPPSKNQIWNMDKENLLDILNTYAAPDDQISLQDFMKKPTKRSQPSETKPSIPLISKENINSGKVQTQFGKVTQIQQSSDAISIQLDPHYTSPVRFGNNTLKSKITNIEKRKKELLENIQKNNSLPDPKNATSKWEEPVFIGGMISSDTENERLNPSSIMLEKVRLETGILNSWNFFPGEIVGLKATNPSCTLLCPDLNNPTVFRPTPKSLPDRSQFSALKSQVSIFIASGPFTSNKNTDYEAIDLLVEQMNQNPPDILILTGPFIDSKQDQNLCLNESYDDIFEEIISRFSSLRQRKMSLILIPSSRDLHHDFVFPQNPFYNKSKVFEGVLMFPNPCFLNIGDFSIGISSEDVLADMNIDFKYKGQKSRMESICTALLQQSSFYPMWPPFMPETGNFIPLDLNGYEQRISFPYSPDLLVLPSETGKPFISNLEQTFILNPAKAIKKSETGTFARINVYPKDPSEERFQTGIEIVNI